MTSEISILLVLLFYNCLKINRPTVETNMDDVSEMCETSQEKVCRTTVNTYFLEYSPGLELNPGQLAHPN